MNNYLLLLVIVVTVQIYFADSQDCFDSTGLVNVASHQYTCSQMVVHNASFCYNGQIRTQCCNTCARIASNNPADCPYGDKSEQWCEDTKPRECYYHHTQNQCCGICNRIRRSNPSYPQGCEYGDKQDYCNDIRNPDIDCRKNNAMTDCCTKCSSFQVRSAKPQKPEKSVVDPVFRPILGDNTPCSPPNKESHVMVGSTSVTCDQMAHSYVAFCYDKWFRDRCCGSCMAKYRAVPGCEWGDRNDIKDCTASACEKKYLRENKCCETCNKLKSGLKI